MYDNIYFAHYIMINYLLVPFIAIAFARIGLHIFRKLNILDKPGNDVKNTRKPVPTIQGIFVYISFIVSIILFFPNYLTNHLFRGLVVGSLPIIIFEIIEELHYIGKIHFKIPPMFRLIVHLIGALLAIRIGRIDPQEIIFQGNVRIMPQRIFAIFFSLRTILCVNAINRFDGIYAQASGISSIGFLTIFLLIQFVVFREYTHFTETNMQILLFVRNISYILCIIAFVSTIVEYKPLGLVRDVGIMFFGFALAYLSVVGGAKIGTLVVVLSLVIFDAIRVGLWRIFVMKKNPLKGDYTHLHHRLLGLGWSRKEIRGFVRIRSVVMMIFILIQGTDRLNKIIIFAVMAFIFFGVNYYLFIIKKLPYGLKLKKNN